MSADREGEVVSALLRSRKYAHLCPATLQRAAGWAVARHPSARDATKAAKRKLHQVYGAYVDQLDLRRLELQTDHLPSPTEGPAFEAACRDLLACHTSTAERLPFVQDLYPGLFELTGVPTTVADLACGLNPFALPWMGLPPGARYRACDIDRRIVDAVARLLAQAGLEGAAEWRDVLASPPEWEADVALLLKSAPCLEQQEPGATARVLRALRAQHVVVSYPTRSLGGRGRGMRRHYEGQARQLAADLGEGVGLVEFPTETFYVLRVG